MNDQFKDINVTLDLSPKKNHRQTNAIIKSFDQNSARFILDFKVKDDPMSLSNVRECRLTFFFNMKDEVNRKRADFTVTGFTDDTVKLIAPKQLFADFGEVECYVGLVYKETGKTNDVGYFTFEIQQSKIDLDVPKVQDYYVQKFEELDQQITAKMLDLLDDQEEVKNGIVLFKQGITADLTALEKKVSDYEVSADARLAVIDEKIAEGELYTAQETDVAVMEIMAGAKDVKKEMQSDFTDKVAGSLVECPHILEADVQALGPRNLIKNGDFKAKSGFSVANSMAYEYVADEVGYHVKMTRANSSQAGGILIVDSADTNLTCSFDLWAADESAVGVNVQVAIRQANWLGGTAVKTVKATATRTRFFVAGLSPSTANSMLTFIPTENGKSVCIDDVHICKALLTEPHPFIPSPEELGVIGGQPNLLNGTSNVWEEYTFSAYDGAEMKMVYLANIGLKVGDTITIQSEIENISGTHYSATKVKFYTSEINGVIREQLGSAVGVGNTGISTLTTTIPEGCTRIGWYKAAKAGTGIESHIKTRGHILIKGPASAMDGWKLSQADSGMTVINEGRSELPQVMYDAAKVAGDGQTLKLVQTIVGKAAELDVIPFNILEQVEREMSWMLTGLTTTAEKVAKIKSALKSFSLASTARASVGTDKVVAQDIANVQWGGWSMARVANSSEFKTLVSDTSSSYSSYIGDKGDLKCRIYSRPSKGPATPATLEIDHISLSVTFEVNGKEYLLQMFVPRSEYNAKIASLENQLSQIIGGN